jgi:endoglycosylceramidase
VYCRAFLLLVLLSAASCASNDDAAPAGPAPAAKARLHRDGRWMVDSFGRVVLSHGVNAVWKVPPYYPPASAAGFVAADADWLAEHGFNSVRAGTLFAGVMPQPDVPDPAFLDGWDRVVQLLAARGIYVLLDFHQDLYNERYAGEGFPDWATDDDGLPMPTSVGFPGNYFTPACSRAFDNFWNDKNGIWDRYRAAWRAVASRWGAQDHLMGYDLINEPWPGTQTATCLSPLGCPVFDDLSLQSLQEHALGGIREVDPDGIVFFEPNVIFNFGAQTNLGLLHAIGDPNIGLSWHKYCLPAALLHAQGFEDIPACPQLHQLVSDNAESAIARIGATTLITEFGASDDLADLDQVVTQADDQLTGWQYWHYKEWADPTTESGASGGQGLFADDTDLSTVKLDKLRVLERAYPQATAGVPLALHFDAATAVFSYRYAPRAAGAPTDIYVPALHYPGGYIVEVSGARIVSSPGARHLLLQNDAAAQEVSVTVHPASGM